MPPSEARAKVLSIISVMHKLRSAVATSRKSMHQIARAYRLANENGTYDCLLDPSSLIGATLRPLDANKPDLVISAATRIPVQRLERAHHMIGDRVIDHLRDRTMEALPDDLWDEYAYHAGEISHKLYDHAYTCLHVLLQEALDWPIRYGTHLNVIDTMEAAVEVFSLLGVGQDGE